MGNTVSAYGALLGLLLTIGLILKKVQPTYAMIIGAIVGGLIGGVSLERSIGFMITGIPSIVPAVIRVITAGVLVGTLIESGAAERIALTIIDKLGHERCLVALMLSTWALTAIGVFGDVACLAVAPIAIQVSERTGFKKMGVLMAMIGGVKAGGAISPNPNTIAAAETFKIPLTSLMLTGFAASLTALVATTFLSKYLAHKGSSFPHIDPLETSKVLPSLWSSLFGPGVAILLLLLRPIVGINVDP
ncbi:D-glycerate transporter [Agrilactobacillus composti DSM 18527 = JCM 14202]|nr:SLC13 family permease [Agrilactobacillus composti]GAF41439.1 D-glycerate transporter [Agrilactobacillus composti DSM 18527 = JCM 14202]